MKKKKNKVKPGEFHTMSTGGLRHTVADGNFYLYIQRETVCLVVAVGHRAPKRYIGAAKFPINGAQDPMALVLTDSGRLGWVFEGALTGEEP